MHVTVIIGRVGQDPKPIGQNGHRISIATESYNSSTQQRETTWSDCVAFGKTSEFVEKWVKKGTLVAVVGEYRTRKYTDNAGVERESASFFIKEIDPFLERKQQSSGGGQTGQQTDGPLWES